MSIFKRLFKKKEPEPVGFVHIDFEGSFPHIFWSSSWGQDSEFPDGFRYKVLSVRHEPGGDLEVVLLQELRDGTKTEMQRFSVPSDKFEASAEMIHMLGEQLGVTFDRVDLSGVRTFEEFETRSREMGWDVS